MAGSGIKILDGKEAVLFDLDGTLIRTPNGVLIGRLRNILRLVSLPERSNEEILKFFEGHDWDNTLRSWGLSEDEFNRFWEIYIDFAENRENDGTFVYDDVISCLERLNGNFKMGIVSSCTSKYLGRQVEKIGKDYFDTYTNVGWHSEIRLQAKPAPDGILYVLDQIDVPPENAAYIGNSDLDTESARNAGCLDVLVDRGENSFSIEPTVKIKSLKDLK